MAETSILLETPSNFLWPQKHRRHRVLDSVDFVFLWPIITSWRNHENSTFLDQSILLKLASNPPHNLKINVNVFIAGLALAALGFVAGGLVQHNRSGYHFKVREAEDFQTPAGAVRWSYVTESVGTPIPDSGTTMLEFEGRTIYKAKRDFQESSPFAKDIVATQNGISWDDGDFSYELKIQKMSDPASTSK